MCLYYSKIIINYQQLRNHIEYVRMAQFVELSLMKTSEQ